MRPKDRLREEQASACASPEDLAFWEAEVLREERDKKRRDKRRTRQGRDAKYWNGGY